jgi:hypothetical protein
MKSGDRQIRAFEVSLTKILGADNFPREALGDLSVLLDTLRRAVNLLTGLMEFRRSFERRPAAKLHELEIILDDLREVLKDLLPSLKKMAKTAYSLCEESTDKEQIKRAKRLLRKVNALQFKRDDQKG